MAISGRTFTYAPSADFAASLKTNLPAVSLTLKDSGGATVATTQSDSTGSYRFESLAAGNYSIEARLIRNGLPNVRLDPASRAFTVGTADVAVPRFSLYSIFGVAKAPDAGGVIGPRANIVVSLKNSSGTVLATRTTLSDGRFSFGKLAAGTYSLSGTKSGFTFADATGLVLPGTVTPFAPALKRGLTGTRNPASKPSSSAREN